MTVLIATLDTKGPEAQYLKRLLQGLGLQVMVMDTGVMGEPLFEAEISRGQVASAGGREIEELVRLADRGEAMRVMMAGAACLAKELHAAGRLQAIVALGGSGGTAIGTAAMRSLPFGIPKVMLSTAASGNTRQYVDTKDITMIYSVADIMGLNCLTKIALANAAGATYGMIKAQEMYGQGIAEESQQESPLIGLSAAGTTTPAAMKCKHLLETRGYTSIVFHATTGVGGRAMEERASEGFLAGILDLTTTELADEVAGGVGAPGSERLVIAGQTGIPQVIAPGGLDFVNLGPKEMVPPRYRTRNLRFHSPVSVLMRTNVEENRNLGKMIAKRLSRTKGPTAVILPLKGFSAYDIEQGVFYDPTADMAFIQSLKGGLPKHIKVVEVNCHINDDTFAQAAVDVLCEMIGKQVSGGT